MFLLLYIGKTTTFLAALQAADGLPYSREAYKTNINSVDIHTCSYRSHIIIKEFDLLIAEYLPIPQSNGGL